VRAINGGKACNERTKPTALPGQGEGGCFRYFKKGFCQEFRFHDSDIIANSPVKFNKNRPLSFVIFSCREKKMCLFF